MNDLYAATLNRALERKRIQSWGTDQDGAEFVKVDDRMFTFPDEEQLSAFCTGLLVGDPAIGATL